MSLNKESDYKEQGVNLVITSASPSPGKDQIFFNPKMAINRELVLLTLASLVKEKKQIPPLGDATATDRHVCIECLDAFTATGAMSLMWKYHLQHSVDVLASDINPLARQFLEQNVSLNPPLRVEEVPSSSLVMSGPPQHPSSHNTVKFVQEDCAVVLLKRAFDFVHLDPFGTTSPFLGSALRHLRHGGILTLTSTDVASLLARTPEVVLRMYGAHVIKTRYNKELAVRVVLQAVARAAAKSNKGIRCLFAVALEHFLLVAVRVVRGCSAANESVARIMSLLHCRVCQQQRYLTNPELVPRESLPDLLPCKCAEQNPGLTAALLGPVWSGPIFCTDFLQQMATVSQDSHTIGSARLKDLLQTLQQEAAFFDAAERASGKTANHSRVKATHFYVNLSCLKVSNCSLPKLGGLMNHLKSFGFLSSVTHFEPRALRTTAELARVQQEILHLQKDNKASQSQSNNENME